MGRLITLSFLLALLATELFAQCPSITIDAGSPHDSIPSGCDDITKRGRWDLHQGSCSQPLLPQKTMASAMAALNVGPHFISPSFKLVTLP